MNLDENEVQSEVIGDDDSSPGVTARVQVLAQGIYDEFQSMVGQFGPESIGNLMPLVVNVLENLDSALADNKDYLTALEETNEENQQLSQQFNKEKALRKEIEEKAGRLEELNEIEMGNLRERVVTLVSDNRNMTAKTSSQREQIERLEEKHETLNRQNKELRDANIDLIKTYKKMDAMERSMAQRSVDSRQDESPSFQDFTSPQFVGSKKKRQLPIAPRKRASTDGEEVLEVPALEDKLPDTTPLISTTYVPSEYSQENPMSPINSVSLHEEETIEIRHSLEEYEEESALFQMAQDMHIEDDHRNDDSLMAEMNLVAMPTSVPGLDHILSENERLHTEKNDLMREVDGLLLQLRETQADKDSIQHNLQTTLEEKSKMAARASDLDKQLKNKRKELEEEKERAGKQEKQMGEGQLLEGPGGLKLTRLEVARVLRERNEYKEKYLSLLEQIRMSDELSLFKHKSKKSRWLDYFTAVFSPAKRRQLEQNLADSTPRRSILPRWSPAQDEEDGSGASGGFPQAGVAGYRKTNTIPVLKKTGKKQDDPPLPQVKVEIDSMSSLIDKLPSVIEVKKTRSVTHHPPIVTILAQKFNSRVKSDISILSIKSDELYMTSVSWVIPAIDQSLVEEEAQEQPTTPSINTCRPMSYQEDGAKILCASSINPAVFIEDYRSAISINKESNLASSTSSSGSHQPTGDSESSISLVWIVTGVSSLTKVSVIDVATMGEVLDTFPVCASPISCITSVPAFDPKDQEVVAGLSTARRKPSLSDSPSQPKAETGSLRPSSQEATMWMGSDTGVLYVHCAVNQWKKCIHADKLPASIVTITHLKGKVFILLQNSNVATFRRFPDGEWDWDNYLLNLLSQRRDMSASAMAPVKRNLWCAVGNTMYVMQSSQLKMEATFQVHQNKCAIVMAMQCVGDGVWMAFKMDSTLKLYNATSFTHMQDLDIAPSVHKLLVFGNEKKSLQMPVQISTLAAAHNSLWVGTENGVLLTYPFTTPSMVAEESGWELIKEAEVGGQTVPEPFDVRTEEGLEAGVSWSEPHPLDISQDSGKSSERSPSHSATESPVPNKSQKARSSRLQFSPFCSVDQVELSIHCHINTVKSLLCVPGMVPRDLAFEPLGGVYIGSGDTSQNQPTLFVMSCGEGHLDLRTADKVLQTLQAKESGQSGLPSPATILSDKNYIMVWDVNA